MFVGSLANESPTKALDNEGLKNRLNKYLIGQIRKVKYIFIYQFFY